MGKYLIEIIMEWCKGCGICIEFCPKKVLEINQQGKVYVKNIEDCSGCRMCEYRCPDYAITVGGDGQNEATN